MSQEDKETIIVVGGNGYVGSRMCEQAILNGYKVISISRSGERPSWLSQSVWSKKVEYVKGNALKPDTMSPYFINNNDNIRGVISCVGCFHWKQSVMRSINGDTNINACKLAKDNDIKRFVCVSAWKPSILTFGGKFNPLSWILVPGYFDGKKKMEENVQNLYGENCVAFRPGMISGKRYISDTFALSLDTISKMYSYFIPVIHADDLAKAAIRFIKSDKPNIDKGNQICENNDINNFYVI